MDEAVNTKGSFAWQSILKARQVIELGVVWRVGNGEKVRIRGDSWLPDPHSSKVILPQKNFPGNTRVCALLNEDGTSWIHDRIEEEFLPHEARTISSIPLSVSHANDCLVWSGSKDGKYTTKSAYRMLTEAEQRKKPGSSNQSSEGTFLKDLWDLDIPSKIKHFLWRASNESHPTKKNLFRRQVTRTAICDCCHSGVEDTIHALWECQAVKETWWEDDYSRQQLYISPLCKLPRPLYGNSQRQEWELG